MRYRGHTPPTRLTKICNQSDEEIVLDNTSEFCQLIFNLLTWCIILDLDYPTPPPGSTCSWDEMNKQLFGEFYGALSVACASVFSSTNIELGFAEILRTDITKKPGLQNLTVLDNDNTQKVKIVRADQSI